MKKFCTILIIVFSLTLCKKNDNPKFSGTVTIDNRSFGATFYAYGFSVPTGQKVSTLNDPLDVITILADFDDNNNVRQIFFTTQNFSKSFYRYGQYEDAAAASLAFKNLTSFATPQWTDSGDSVKVNQIWLYRTSAEKYAKLRIINTVAEKRENILFPYAECTFEWVYQPDGSLTFP